MFNTSFKCVSFCPFKLFLDSPLNALDTGLPGSRDVPLA